MSTRKIVKPPADAIASPNPTGHYVTAPDGRVVTLPTGQPLKEGWRWSTQQDLKAAAARAQKNEADEAERADRDRVAVQSVVEALNKATATREPAKSHTKTAKE